MRGIGSNYSSIPMVCPQCDKRQGWLGDHSEGPRGETHRLDNAALHSKWLLERS